MFGAGFRKGRGQSQRHQKRQRRLSCTSRTAPDTGRSIITERGASLHRSRIFATAACAGEWTAPRFPIRLRGPCRERNKMARTPQRTSATKQAERLKALARAKRLLNFKRKHEPVIPGRVLKQ